MMELRLDRMVHGGVALARLPGGRVALVRGGIPGELVRAGLSEVSGVLQGEVEEVLEGSSDRVPAPLHPGLDYGHIRYPRQLELKREVVRDALRRALPAGEEAPQVEATSAAPAIWRYRSAVQPVVTPAGLGYRRPGSREPVPLASDPVANAALDHAWKLLAERPFPKGVREVAMRGNDEGETLLALIATSPPRTLIGFAHELVELGVAGVSYARYDARGRFRSGSERLAGGKRIGQRYGRYELSVSATSFAQPNPAAASRLLLELEELVGRGAHAVELFAGGGAISFHLAGAFDRVDAVEIDRSSVARGQRDAERLGLENVRFVKADARRFEIPPSAELLAVDPPRSGLGRDAREAIDRSNAGRLLYVACDPATWARDVADLRQRGWRLQRALPFDFYPHTHHIEMLSLLLR